MQHFNEELMNSVEADEKEIHIARNDKDTYTKAIAIYDESTRQHGEALTRIGGLEQQNASLTAGIVRCGELERSILAIPQKELEHQAGLLEMNHYTITVGDDIGFNMKDGRSPKLMSHGEGMKAANALSLKLNSMMQRPINMIFVDNAEGIDDPDVGALSNGSRQVFLASVDPECETLKIDVN